MLTLLCDLCSGDKDSPVRSYTERDHEDSVAHLGEGQKEGWPEVRAASLLLLFLQTFPAAPNSP